MKFIKHFYMMTYLMTLICFLMSATTCVGSGTDTGNPMNDDYGQCGEKIKPGTISTSCVATPAPAMHVAQMCKKLNSCFNVDPNECYNQVMEIPGLSREINLSVETFSELWKLYREKTVIYNGKLFDECMKSLNELSCDSPLVQNSISQVGNKTDYTNSLSLIHVDPSCKLIYSYK